MLRYDIFYLVTALLASPVVAVRLLSTGKWRTDWRGRFGHVGRRDEDSGRRGGDEAQAPAPASDVPAPAVGAPGLPAAASGSPTPSAPIPSAATPAPHPPTVLVHGVSVGEVAATRKLVGRLARHARVVVSSTTDTGVERARSLYGTRHAVVRYPFDLSWMVRRFLDAVRPDVVALTELEVWPNFVTECTRRGIPVCVVNGRLSASSHRGYRCARGWVAPVFRQLAAVGAQNETYARRFADLGVPPDRMHVTDTMKWDTSAPAADSRTGPRTSPADTDPRTGPRTSPAAAAARTGPAADDPRGSPDADPRTGPAAAGPRTGPADPRPPAAEALAAALGIDPARPLIVAGSTGPGEEAKLIAARPPAAQLLLVPRKPERFDTVAALDPGIRRRSAHPETNTPAHPHADPAAQPRADNPAQPHAAPAAHPRAGPTAQPHADPAAHPSAAAGPRTDLFLLDTMGELELAYALADVAVVGRSFTPTGGSDPIPPVAAGCATLIGPHHENFAHVVAALRAGGGLTVASSPEDAMQTAALLLRDADARRRMARNGQRVVDEHRGASARSAELVLELVVGRSQV